MLKPRGVGGVASVIDAVAPHLPDHVRIVGGSDLPRLLRATAGRPVVHLHPSLRWRAILRDGALHRLLRARGCATLVHWHGVDRALVRRIDASSRARGALRHLFGDAGRTFVVLPELAERLRGWGIDRVEVVANPAPAPTPRSRPEPHRVLFLGRLEEDKGVAALAVAIRLLRRRWPDATLAVAGAGPIHVDGPGIERLGWIDAARRRAELARASVLALPTRDDAAPVVVLEALAAGVPVVATRVGAIPAMVGGHGVLIERADPASIASGIERAWGRRWPAPDLAVHRPEHLAARWTAAYEALACG